MSVEGFRPLEHRDREAAIAALKAKLQRAAAQAERGEFVDPEQVLREIETLKRQRAAAQ